MTNGHIGKNSYCCNLAIMDCQLQDQDGDGCKGPRKTVSVRSASQIIMLGEARAADNAIRHSSSASFKCGPAGKTWEYTVRNATETTDPGKAGYHNRTNNWCFADGSLRTMPWKQTYTSVTENLWLFK